MRNRGGESNPCENEKRGFPLMAIRRWPTAAALAAGRGRRKGVLTTRPGRTTEEARGRLPATPRAPAAPGRPGVGR